MNAKTEKDIVLYYLNNLLKRTVSGDIENRICDWFEENSRELIGREIADLWENRRYGWNHKNDTEEHPLPRNIRSIRQFLGEKTGRFVLSSDVKAVIDAFHLAPESHDILAMRIYAAKIPLLTPLIDYHNTNQILQMLSGMMGISLRRHEKFYSPSSELRTKGLFGNEHRCRESSHEMTAMLNAILASNCHTPNMVKRVVLGNPLTGALKPVHFEHLREEYDWLRNLLSNTLAKKKQGINILIYGKPGTGKTEFAKTLCKEIGVPLYGVSNNQDEERNPAGRRSDLAAALCVLQGDHRSVLLMDEAEDVFAAAARTSSPFGMFSPSPPPQGKSKLFFNHLLETNTVPVVWISNDIHGVDPAHLRRFSYAMNMESPDESVQARIWAQSARKNKLTLPKEKIESLVKTYDIAPAIIDTSLRTASLTGDHAAIEKTIESLQMAMTGRVTKHANHGETEFSTELLNCDLDLGTLTKRILDMKENHFSLCLYGIPGSGKSAYARHLARAMNMRVLHKRASDIISMWVGGTERNIAAAFSEAKRKKMLLVIDEADSFLRDRRHAQQNFEVSAVNEMLTQMESHPLPFVCTTNLMKDLDQASLRRFTFKVKYDYLSQKQVKRAFSHFFGEESAVSLSELSHLAPGDFAVVAKKAKICGIADHKELVSMLRQEQDVKEGAVGKPLGFASL